MKRLLVLALFLAGCSSDDGIVTPPVVDCEVRPVCEHPRSRICHRRQIDWARECITNWDEDEDND